jgi:hypothetical protein
MRKSPTLPTPFSGTCSTSSARGIPGPGGTTFFSFGDVPWATGITSEDIEASGVDIEIRSGTAVLASSRRALPRAKLVAGDKLFNGGLKYWLSSKDFPQLVVTLQPSP